MQSHSLVKSIHSIIDIAFMKALYALMDMNQQPVTVGYTFQDQVDPLSISILETTDSSIQVLKQLLITELEFLSDYFTEAQIILEPFINNAISKQRNSSFLTGSSGEAKKDAFLKCIRQVFAHYNLFITVPDLLFAKNRDAIKIESLKKSVENMELALQVKGKSWLHDGLGMSHSIDAASAEELKIFAFNIIEIYKKYFEIREKSYARVGDKKKESFNQYEKVFHHLLKTELVAELPSLYLRQLMLAFFEYPQFQNDIYYLINKEATGFENSINVIARPPLPEFRDINHKKNLTVEASILSDETPPLDTLKTPFLRNYIKDLFAEIARFQNEFAHWPKRAEAIAIAEKLTRGLQSLPQTHALYHVSHSLINKHENILSDLANGLHNTRSWQKIIIELSNKAAEFAIKASQELVSSEDILAFLNFAREFPLIKNHSSNFIITGAFGNTPAFNAVTAEISKIQYSVKKREKLIRRFEMKEVFPNLASDVTARYASAKTLGYKKSVLLTRTADPRTTAVYTIDDTTDNKFISSENTFASIRNATHIGTNKAVLIIFYPLTSKSLGEKPFTIDEIKNNIRRSREINASSPNIFVDSAQSAITLDDSSNRFLCVVTERHETTLEDYLKKSDASIATLLKIKNILIKIFNKQRQMWKLGNIYVDNNFNNILLDKNENPRFLNTEAISSGNLAASLGSFMQGMHIRLLAIFSKVLKTDKLNDVIEDYLATYLPLIVTNVTANNRPDSSVAAAINELFNEFLYQLTVIRSTDLDHVPTKQLMLAYFDNLHLPDYQDIIFKAIIKKDNLSSIAASLKDHATTKELFPTELMRSYIVTFYKLVEKLNTKFPALASALSSDNLNQKDESIKIVNELLPELTSFEEAHALYQICKFHINLHQFELLDAVIGLKKCHSWQEIFKALRNKAVEILLTVSSLDNPEDRIQYLQLALSTPLIYEHSTNFIITGAFGKSSPIKIIETEISKIIDSQNQYAEALKLFKTKKIALTDARLPLFSAHNNLLVTDVSKDLADIYEVSVDGDDHRKYIFSNGKKATIAEATQLLSAQSVRMIIYTLNATEEISTPFIAEDVAAQWQLAQSLNEKLPGVFAHCFKMGEVINTTDTERPFSYVLTPHYETNLECYLAKNTTKPAALEVIKDIFIDLLIKQKQLYQLEYVYTDGRFNNIALDKNNKVVFLNTEALNTNVTSDELKAGFEIFMQEIVTNMMRYFNTYAKADKFNYETIITALVTFADTITHSTQHSGKSNVTLIDAVERVFKTMQDELNKTASNTKSPARLFTPANVVKTDVEQPTAVHTHSL